MKKIDFNIFENKEEIKEEWQKVYKERSKKVGQKRAIISANAKAYSVALKHFIESQQEAIGTETIFVYEDVKDYKTYNVDNNKVIVTTEKKVLDDFPMAERKGQFKDMDDAFEREILSKLIDEYELTLSPEMYYIINGDR